MSMVRRFLPDLHQASNLALRHSVGSVFGGCYHWRRILGKPLPISGEDGLGGKFLQVLIAMKSSNNERGCGRTATWETSFHKFRVSSKDT